LSNYRQFKQALLAAFLIGLAGNCSAVVTADATGINTNVTAGPNFNISGGTVTGSNLFHSFNQFSLVNGDVANFLDPGGGIMRVFGRVTGGAVSSIDGVIQSSIPMADIYLINPAGIVFDNNASLNISGAFHATTADFIRFADGNTFDATTPGNSVLTIAAPTSFGFLDAAADIRVNGSTLTAPPNTALSLVGGNIIFENNAQVKEQSGRINIAAVASAGEALNQPMGIDVSNFIALADVRVQTGAQVDVNAPGQAGEIYIRAGNLFVESSGKILAGTGVVDGGLIDIVVSDTVQVKGTGVANATTISTNTNNVGRSGNINISAKDVVVLDEGRIEVTSDAAGDAGLIRINTERLSVTNQGQVSATVNGNGDAGGVLVNASESIFLSGNDFTPMQATGIFSNSLGANLSTGSAGTIILNTPSLVLDSGQVSAVTTTSGNGEMINITADNISLRNGGFISAESRGSGFNGGSAGDIFLNVTGTIDINGVDGNSNRSRVTSSVNDGVGGGISQININATDLNLSDQGLIQASTSGTRNAGLVTLDVTRLNISDAGNIDTSSSGIGRAGGILVTASESVSISSALFTPMSPTGLTSNAFAAGDGGGIMVSTPTLAVNGGTISAVTTGIGDGFNVTVNGDNVSLINGGFISTSAFGSGDGGSLNVNVTGDILVSGQDQGGFISRLSSETRGRGLGGDINVSGANLTLSNGGFISTDSNGINPLAGDAGNIDITTAETVQLLDSFISTTAEVADGGNIDITTTDLLYLLNSQIATAVRSGTGDGGNITIDPTFVILNNSSIIADAFGGNGGNINITADFFFASQNSTVSASSALGIDGTILIDAPDTDISGSLQQLPDSFLDVTALLSERCSVSSASTSSSFVISGRGGVPANPGQYLSGSVTDLISSEELLTSSNGSKLPLLSLGCGG